MTTSHADAETQLARIEEMIARYREEKRRLLLRCALELWLKAEADEQQALAELSRERRH